MILQEINQNLQISDKPVTKVLIKNDKTRLLAIGLKKGVEMANHKAPSFARIYVIKGRIKYISDTNNVELSYLDEHEIPLEEVHRVVGLENSIFLLTIRYE
ncbi:MAG: hypothetical protein WAS72_12910 [Saprospiraceae bacterium]